MTKLSVVVQSLLHLEGYRQRDFAEFMGVSYPTLHKMLADEQVIEDVMNLDGQRLKKDYEDRMKSRRTTSDLL